MEKQSKREKMDFSSEKKALKVIGLMVLIYLVIALVTVPFVYIVVKDAIENKNILPTQISLAIIYIVGGFYIQLLIPLLLWIFISYKEKKGKITEFQRLIRTASKIMFFIVLILKISSIF